MISIKESFNIFNDVSALKRKDHFIRPDVELFSDDADPAFELPLSIMEVRNDPRIVWTMAPPMIITTMMPLVTLDAMRGR